MEVSREDGEIPIPISSSYGGHMIHHHHDPALLLVVPHSSPQAQSQLLPCSNGLVPTPTPTPTPTSLSLDNDNHDHDHSTEVVPYNSNGNGNGKKVVVIKYRECLKNHAAAMGGAATDGCGEFMPSGEEGTIEALTCSACSCHRNFHRKELQGHHHDHFNHHHISSRNRRERKLILGHHHHHSNHLMADALPLGLGYPTPAAAGTLISSRPPPPHHHHMVMPSSAYNMNMSMDMSDDSGGGPQPQQVVKKRFRTKFSQEQKDKMVKFAERVGWRIQKQEESVVQHFCQEIGVKRRVLKVWMHNNKHNLANKLIPSATASTATATAPPAHADAASLH